MAAGGGFKRRYQYCSDNFGTIVYLRALQGHSGSNLIDPYVTGQRVDWTWNIPLHLPRGMHIQSSLYYQQWIDTWRSEFEQKTNSISSCLLIQEMKVTETLNILTFLYHVSRDTCTVHGRDIKTRYFGSILILESKRDLTFYQTRSNATILQGTLPAHCISRVERLKTGEKLYERQYLSPRPPPKISLKHDLNWTKGNDQSGSTVEHQPVGKLVQQSLGETLQAGSSKPTQFPKPIEDGTGKPVTQEIVGKSQGELSSSDRTGEPVKDEDKRVMKVHDRTGKPVEGSSHKVQEVGSLEHRDDADKFNLAIDDENIDVQHLRCAKCDGETIAQH